MLTDVLRETPERRVDQSKNKVYRALKPQDIGGFDENGDSTLTGTKATGMIRTVRYNLSICPTSVVRKEKYDETVRLDDDDVVSLLSASSSTAAALMRGKLTVIGKNRIMIKGGNYDKKRRTKQ